MLHRSIFTMTILFNQIRSGYYHEFTSQMMQADHAAIDRLFFVFRSSFSEQKTASFDRGGRVWGVLAFRFSEFLDIDSWLCSLFIFPIEKFNTRKIRDCSLVNLQKMQN